MLVSQRESRLRNREPGTNTSTTSCPTARKVRKAMRSRLFLLVGVAMLALDGCSGGEETAPRPPPTSTVSPQAVAELAPTGTLRFAVLLYNSNLAAKDPATGELRGVSLDLGRELAARLGVPFVAVEITAIGDAPAARRAGAWDVSPFGVAEPGVEEVDLTPPFLETDNTYLVRPGSQIRTAADADQPGFRIAVLRPSSSFQFLSRSLKNAELIPAATPEAAFDLVKTGQADAWAAARERLLKDAPHLPGARVLEDHFDVLQITLALPKGRVAGIAYLKEFVAQAKDSGFLKESIQRANLRGVQVAP